jgi:hypothetical protein
MLLVLVFACLQEEILAMGVIVAQWYMIPIVFGWRINQFLKGRKFEWKESTMLAFLAGISWFGGVEESLKMLQQYWL